MNMKDQRWGVEVEMTGLTREAAARVLAKLFGTVAYYTGGAYKSWEVKDHEGRTWSLKYDSSILPKKQIGRDANGKRQYASTISDDWKTELVTPVLEYKDIPKLQEVIRALRKAGAIVNESCGIHVHVDAANHHARSLRNLINIMASKEDMLYRALKVSPAREERYCRKIKYTLVKKVNEEKPQDMAKLADMWYEGSRGPRNWHYNETRYAGLNLHNVWFRGTVEFRMFNGTLHAGEIKAYIQLCLAISAQAINQKSARPAKTTSTNEKFTFRTWLLRLGLIGDEFETARKHLLKHLEGDAAWRYGHPQMAVGQ